MQPSPPAHPNATLDWPDGMHPGVNFFGTPTCLPDGDYNPNEGAGEAEE
jgi:hypothetical protein